MRAFTSDTAVTEIPIFGISNSTIHHLIAWIVDNYSSIIFVLGFWHVLRTYFIQVQSFFWDNCTATVYLKQHDEAFDMLFAWVSSRGLQDVARSAMVRVNASHADAVHGTKKALHFRPWNGSFYFWYGNSILHYQTQSRDDGFIREEIVSITCLGRSTQVVQTLLEECRDAYLSQIKNKTTIFENREDKWRKVATKRIRPSSTVVLTEEQKYRLVDDVKSFVDPDTQLWFADRTIPYRRGYLLYGPPGTGKSSFSLSVAGELDLDIYIINIGNVSDQTLKDLFLELPQKCVILLEDIDAVGKIRASDVQQKAKNSQEPRETVTMSGLLNSLDGVASQEGRILIMTTNHIDHLDEALIRPGRVDMKAEFQFADARMIAQLFEFIFQDRRGQTRDDSEQIAAVRDMAITFAKKLPECKFSPAQIISFLLPHRRSPTEALARTDAWVTSTLRKRILDSSNKNIEADYDTESWDSANRSLSTSMVHESDESEGERPAL